MRNLFETTAGAEMKARIAQVRPDSERLWGKMNAAQAVAHCAAGLELALGDRYAAEGIPGADYRASR